uniref:Uncharacterized protein n=1 Tax=viral metagenome TaxID=1070528 RepID=A0A6C0JTB2_9ZZZZ
MSTEKGTYHRSDFAIDPHNVEISVETLTRPSQEHQIYTSEQLGSHFLAELAVVFSFPRMRCKDEEHMISFVDEYYDKLVTKAVFTHVPSGVSFSLDAGSIELSNNFLGRRGPLPMPEEGNLIPSHNVKVPLLFPFCKNNDGSFPLIYSREEVTGKPFEVSIEVANMSNIIEVTEYDTEGEYSIPFSPNLFKGSITPKIKVTAELRTETDRNQANTHFAKLPRDIHYPVMTLKGTDYGVEKSFECVVQNKGDMCLGIFWLVQAVNENGDIVDDGSEPMKMCTLKTGDHKTIVKEAFPEETRNYPGKLSIPYRKKGIHAIPLSVKPIRQRNCHPLRGTSEKTLTLSMKFKKRSGIKYRVLVYVLASTTLTILGSKEKGCTFNYNAGNTTDS